MSADWVSAWSAVVTAATAVLGVGFGLLQFAKVNRTLKLNSLSILLSAENGLSQCKRLVTQATKELLLEREADSPSETRLSTLQGSFEDYREDWYNAADRLAYCILNGYIDNDRMHAEYRNYFRDIIRNDAASFAEGTEWRNVVDLNNKWQRN